jgi:hypothetical protein
LQVENVDSRFVQEIKSKHVKSRITRAFVECEKNFQQSPEDKKAGGHRSDEDRG